MEWNAKGKAGHQEAGLRARCHLERKNTLRTFVKFVVLVRIMIIVWRAPLGLALERVPSSHNPSTAR